MLEKQCTQFSLATTGPRHELISRLAKYLRSKERLMITDGKTKSSTSYDTVGIANADDEDLPKNINELERDYKMFLSYSFFKSLAITLSSFFFSLYFYDLDATFIN